MLRHTYSFALAKEGVDSLVYVGQSQGAAQAFAALNFQPQIIPKIKRFVALAPGVFLKHSPNR
jgi:pimeloyl-ACP methyl ester carboxylesterase